MAVDMFLKIDGIKGESQDKKHKDQIDLMSWSWGASNAGSHSTGGGGGGWTQSHTCDRQQQLDTLSP